MYSDPEVAVARTLQLTQEDLDEWRIRLTDPEDGPVAVAGIGVGIVPKQYTTLPYIPQPKPQRQFVVIDGQVYINAAFIKENTL